MSGITQFSGGALEFFQGLDYEILKYLDQILNNITSSQEKLERLIEVIIIPRHAHKIVLLLKPDTTRGKKAKVSDEVERFVLFARKYERVLLSEIKNGMSIDEALTYFDRAKSQYEAWAAKLLKREGYTNEDLLIKSFAARLTKAIHMKNKQEQIAQDSGYIP